MSLRTRLLILLLPPVLIITAVIIIFSQIRLSSTAMEQAFTEADRILQVESRPFTQTVNRAYIVAKTLADQFATTVQKGNTDRTYLSSSLHNLIDANPQLFGVWTIWEPNAFDGKDSELPQSDFDTESGSINIYWVRESDGSLVPVRGEDSDRQEEYYTLPKLEKKVSFPDVYHDPAVDKYISTVSAPIIHEGTFLGAVGVDQALADIRKRLASIKPYETGYVMLISPDGTIIASPSEASVGKSVKDFVSDKEFQAISKNIPLDFIGISPFTKAEMLTVYRPVTAADGQLTWSFAVSVPKETILAKNTTTIRIMMGVGILGLLAVSCLIVLAVTSVTKALGQGIDYARAVASGNLDAEYKTDRKDELGVLATALSSMVTRIRNSLAEADTKTKEAQIAAEKAEGALKAEADRAAVEEQQRQGMLAVASNLETIVAALHQATQTLEGQVQQAVRGADSTLAQSEKSALAALELDHASGSMADNAAKASNLAEKARLEAAKGTGVMQEMTSAVAQINTNSMELKQSLGDLGSQVEGIGTIMNAISEVADQTNLLALNAAIEAARAGEAGRGFAVVADEVRKLAERTMQATGEVAKVVKSIQEGTRSTIAKMDSAVALVEKSTDLADKTGQMLADIQTLVKENSDQIHTITQASSEQNDLSSTIRESSETVKEIASQTADAMQVSSGTVHELAEIARKLGELTALLRKQ